MSDTLHQEPERDQFKSESPIRAFTNWTVQGRYALGKGFRPSLAHVIPYLNAMEAKEGWQIVQVLEADTQTPSFLFRQVRVIPDEVLLDRLRGDEGFKQQVRDMLCPVMPEITYQVRGKITLDDVDNFLRDQGLLLAASPDGCFRMYQLEEPYDDPHLPGFEEAGEKMDAMRKRVEADFSDDVDPASRDPLTGDRTVEDCRPKFTETSRHDLYDIACGLSGRGWTEKASLRDLEGHSKSCNSRATGFFKDCSCGRQRIIGKAPELGMPYHPVDALENIAEQMVDGHAIKGVDRESFAAAKAVIDAEDDPINPKHYGGTACAEIGELLSANSYQVLKYNWRLGEKDSPCVEIGKSIWYLDRELALIAEGNTFVPGNDRLPDHTFFDLRLEGRSEHTVKVARSLISWNRYGNPETLKLLRRVLQSTLDGYNGCKDWGSGLAI